MDRPERLQARLNNIHAVRPILAGLKTLSSGSRLRALHQAKRVGQYRSNLAGVLELIVPSLPVSVDQSAPPRAQGQSLLLVIGSEHGLCGAFNEAVLKYGESLLARNSTGVRTDLCVLGNRLQRSFRRRGIVPLWSGPLSLSSLPPYELARDLASQWLTRYEQGELDSVWVVYNTYRGPSTYEPSEARFLPPQLPELRPTDLDWPPIMETDATSLFIRTVELWLSATLYAILLESAAAEHAARYRILDGAVQNAGRLMDELKLQIQSARQDAITAELQDLASGAGLVG